VVPSPSEQDLKMHHRKFFDKKGKQVIFHNLGTGIADAPFEELQILQQFLDDLENEVTSFSPCLTFNIGSKQQANDVEMKEQNKLTRHKDNCENNSPNLRRFVEELAEMYVKELKQKHLIEQDKNRIEQDKNRIEQDKGRIEQENNRLESENIRLQQQIQMLSQQQQQTTTDTLSLESKEPCHDRKYEKENTFTNPNVPKSKSSNEINDENNNVDNNWVHIDNETSSMANTKESCSLM